MLLYSENISIKISKDQKTKFDFLRSKKINLNTLFRAVILHEFNKHNETKIQDKPTIEQLKKLLDNCF